MAVEPGVVKTEESPSADAQESQEGGLADYLRAPQRKKRNYIAAAFSEAFDPQLRAAIQDFCVKNFPKLTYHELRNAKDVRKFGGRDVTLLIMDDEFLPLDDGLSLIAEVKRKKGQVALPTIFLTRRESDLIRAYHQILSPYQEVDDYINYRKAPPHWVLNKVQKGVSVQNRRRSRRYQVDVKSDIFLLRENRSIGGKIIDISLHGAVITSDEQLLFRDRDQIRLRFPLFPLAIAEEGDYLRISGRIHRVHISGSRAAIRFEHMTERQHLLIAKFVIAYSALRASQGVPPKKQEQSA
jgi:PilZ domain